MREPVRATRLLAAAGAAAALLLAGCGGGAATPGGPPLTRAGYEAKVAQIERDLTRRFGSISTDPTQLSAQRLAKVQEALRFLADRLERLNAPSDVDGLQARFVSALRSYADELPQLAAKLKAAGTDPSAGLDALLGSKPLQTLLAVSKEFDRKGYRLGP